MAGHSKWANIKHRKSAQDAKRAKIFTKIIRELTTASKEGGPDPESNPRLRLAIQNARGANMPKDTIERAIKKGQGGDAESYQEVTFEGYGPHGIAIFIEATTDNNNRTVANIRAIFNKHNGSLDKKGALEFMFERKGVFTIPVEQVKIDPEEFEMELIDGGLEEIVKEDDV
ncbi:MAG: YebC/PmpR family DNA-binding transcriptional regulator [Bacteroidetes bacterium]|nr:MAG: YebC/PmpR family DNA-binding transcriptional regulator [Bacteroidota bacterium]